MTNDSLIRNIMVSLRGLNGGCGRQQLVERGIRKMNMEELVEFNQLVLNIQSVQSARMIMKGSYHRGRR